MYGHTHQRKNTLTPKHFLVVLLSTLLNVFLLGMDIVLCAAVLLPRHSSSKGSLYCLNTANLTSQLYTTEIISQPHKIPLSHHHQSVLSPAFIQHPQHHRNPHVTVIQDPPVTFLSQYRHILTFKHTLA